jgi:hypothetical protein
MNDLVTDIVKRTVDLTERLIADGVLSNDEARLGLSKIALQLSGEWPDRAVWINKQFEPCARCQQGSIELDLPFEAA